MATKAKIALINAFLKLVEENEYNKITVTNLVEKCNISRQTFYYHFDDIDTMIEWAFDNETKKICDSINNSKLTESAEMYAAFFKRYDTLLSKAIKTSDCIKIYNLINKSFYDFLAKYLSNRQGGASVKTEEGEFFLSYCAGASSGLVLQEIQKSDKDYSEVMKRLAKSLKNV